jgi:hypothetical protein
MIQFLIILIVYILSWGFLWISEIPQDVFRDQLLDEPRTILAIALLAITVPIVAGGVLVLTILEEIIPGGIDI